jgi:hypothetical protein
MRSNHLDSDHFTSAQSPSIQMLSAHIYTSSLHVNADRCLEHSEVLEIKKEEEFLDPSSCALNSAALSAANQFGSVLIISNHIGSGILASVLYLSHQLNSIRIRLVLSIYKILFLNISFCI